MKVSQLGKLSNLLFFTKESLRQLEPNRPALDFNLKYWLKKGTIISVKNGLYILKDKWEKTIDKQAYLEYLSNKIYQPSYLSLEYVMNKYSLLTEAVYGLTSTTTKIPKTFINGLEKFSYYSISPRLFTGYRIEKFNSAPVFIASKAKAVFDYLYLRFLKNAAINQKTVAQLRINWENLSKAEFAGLRRFAKISGSLRLNRLIELIEKTYYA